VPPPEVPAPPLEVPPVAAGLEGLAPPEFEAAEPPLAAPLGEAALDVPLAAPVPAVVVVGVVVVVAGAEELADAEVGTVSGGAPEVSADGEPPPPHAPSTAQRTIPRAGNAIFRYLTNIPAISHDLRRRAVPFAGSSGDSR
jgi:hypothetical protein